MSTEEAEGDAVYGGRVPPNQHKKKRRKKRRHGQATEAESAAAAAAAAAAATAPRGKKARRKRSGGSADAAAEAAEAVADQQQVMVGAVVPKDMCAGQIMAVSVGEDRQLYVKIPLNCQAFDGLRIQVPDLLWADLPPVRDEDAPDTSSGNDGGGGGGGVVAVGARADEKEKDDHEHSSGGNTKKQKKNKNKKTKKVEVEAVAPAQEAAGRAVGGAKPADPSFFSGKGIVSAGKLARAQGLREYSVRLADVAAQDGADFGESLAIALRQARVVGGKYRYGSVLVSGADFCPAVSGGSNYAKYGHKKIHAELCSLKGLSPQVIVGKDVIIARLAPTDKFCSFAKQGKIDATSAEGRRLIEKEKLLNARPCANCQAAMVRRGIRRVFFTRGHGLLGVLELNVFATVVEKLN